MPRRKQNTGKKKRPIAVVIISLLLLIMISLRVYWVYDTALVYHLFNGWANIPLWDNGLTQAAMDLALGVFRLSWAITALVVLIGIYQMKRWGWVMIIMWVGTSLAIGLVRYFNSATLYSSDYFVMATDTVLAYILNQTGVQVIDGIRGSDGD